MDTRTDNIWDHARDLAKHEPSPRLDQRTAAASLIGYCEGLCSSGLLGEEAEAGLRRRIVVALVAFDMPSNADPVRP